MSLAISASTIAAYASVAAAAYSIYNGQQQTKVQKSAQQQARDAADRQAKLAEQEANKGNSKRPDSQAILDAAMLAGKGGASGTMLTGAQGVDPNAMQLGKATLLGG